MWYKMCFVVLVTSCVVGTSNVRLKRQLFSDKSFRPFNSQRNHCLLRLDPPIFQENPLESGLQNSYYPVCSDTEDENRPVNQMKSQEGLKCYQLTEKCQKENNQLKTRRAKRAVKKIDYGSLWDDSDIPRYSRYLKTSRVPKSADIEDEDEEDSFDKYYRAQRLSSLPKGRYLLIPSSRIKEIFDLMKKNTDNVNDRNIVSEKLPLIPTQKTPGTKDSKEDNIDKSTIRYVQSHCPECKNASYVPPVKTSNQRIIQFSQPEKTRPEYLEKYLPLYQKPIRYSNYDKKTKRQTLPLTDSNTHFSKKDIKKVFKPNSTTSPLVYQYPRYVMPMNHQSQNVPIFQYQTSKSYQPQNWVSSYENQNPGVFSKIIDKNISKNANTNTLNTKLSLVQRSKYILPESSNIPNYFTGITDTYKGRKTPNWTTNYSEDANSKLLQRLIAHNQPSRDITHKKPENTFKYSQIHSGSSRINQYPIHSLSSTNTESTSTDQFLKLSSSSPDVNFSSTFQEPTSSSSPPTKETSSSDQLSTSTDTSSQSTSSDQFPSHSLISTDTYLPSSDQISKGNLSSLKTDSKSSVQDFLRSFSPQNKDHKSNSDQFPSRSFISTDTNNFSSSDQIPSGNLSSFKTHSTSSVQDFPPSFSPQNKESSNLDQFLSQSLSPPNSNFSSSDQFKKGNLSSQDTDSISSDLGPTRSLSPQNKNSSSPNTDFLSSDSFPKGDLSPPNEESKMLDKFPTHNVSSSDSGSTTLDQLPSHSLNLSPEYSNSAKLNENPEEETNSTNPKISETHPVSENVFEQVNVTESVSNDDDDITTSEVSSRPSSVPSPSEEHEIPLSMTSPGTQTPPENTSIASELATVPELRALPISPTTTTTDPETSSRFVDAQEDFNSWFML